MNRIGRRTLFCNSNRGVLTSAVLFLLFAMILALLPHRAAAGEDTVLRVSDLDFTSVRVKGTTEAEILFGDTPRLELRGSKAQLDAEPFYITGNTLVLGENREGKLIDDLKVRVIARTLEAVQLLGSGEVYVRSLVAEDFQVALKGSGDIRLHGIEADNAKLMLEGSGDLQVVKLSARSVYLAVSGSGDIQVGELGARELQVALKGSGDIVAQGTSRVDTAMVYVLGSGDVNLAELAADAATINILGSGDAVVGEVDALDVMIFGSGNVYHRGEPEISDSLLGSGTVIQRRGDR